MRALTSLLIPIHPEGHRFIAIFAAITLVLFLASDFLGWIGVVLTLWCAWFFRDPARISPQNEGVVVSPADGVVNMISEASPPPELNMGDAPLLRISVFMNVFNAHINRMPIGGQVKRTFYRAGQFLSADLDKASQANERQTLLLETANATQIVVVQIAGLVARRIVCWAEEGQSFKTGERFGLIRFGSRCDIYLPQGTQALVGVGQSAIAGETIIADLGHDLGQDLGAGDSAAREFNTD
ncbi:MAG: phosphatidylserine decarboxylase [Alphaproteobacteria bacterium]|nr:phosphatidylserine decarboxylase [Alphaproteobacteria bacterium]MBE8219998.1 phosphatidylserine decarboxylase [Alphaproteobacteria bacterium]